MTVKELTKELQKEKFDVKKTPVYLSTQGQRFEIKGVDIFDGEVILRVGDAVEAE